MTARRIKESSEKQLKLDLWLMSDMKIISK